MPKKFNWDEQKRVGDDVSALVANWILGRPDTFALISVEDDPEYRAMDIDFIWLGKSGIRTLEVKGDTYTTGNIYFETVSNLGLMKPGCFVYSLADYWMYYFIGWRRLYIFPMKRVREWFFLNEVNFKAHTVENEFYTSCGRIVPLAELERLEGVKKYDIEL